MAANLFKELLKKIRPQDADQWLVESAGTWTENGRLAAVGANLAMTAYGIDLSSHRSQVVTKELIEKFNLILVMEYGHRESLRIEFPQDSKKIFLLSEMTGAKYEINDPIGGHDSDYQASARQIQNLLEEGQAAIIRLACI